MNLKFSMDRKQGSCYYLDHCTKCNRYGRVYINSIRCRRIHSFNINDIHLLTNPLKNVWYNHLYYHRLYIESGDRILNMLCNPSDIFDTNFHSSIHQSHNYWHYNQPKVVQCKYLMNMRDRKVLRIKAFSLISKQCSVIDKTLLEVGKKRNFNCGK